MNPPFKIKRLPDGRAVLNLGCGTRMHWAWNNLDFSPYALLARHGWMINWLSRLHLLSPLRRERLRQVDPAIIYWDLRRGIPFPADQLDGVYHSHFLEHLDQGAAPGFLRECQRVLKPGGIIRVVVPDLQFLVQQYLAAVRAFDEGDAQAAERHAQAMHDLFDQMVRREATGAQEEQTGWKQRLEAWGRGGAGATGELHRWMYDRHSLACLLADTGFRHVRVEDFAASRIQDWEEFRLDMDEAGCEYKPGSLYLEGEK
jgi:SAM-dependent methyltransferase